MIISSDDKDAYLNRIQTDSAFKGSYGQSVPRTSFLNQNLSEEMRFDVCPEYFLTIPLVIYTKKNFYLLDALSEKIEILKASGLIDFWQAQDVNREILNYKKPVFPKALELKIFLGCFEILLFGGFASLVLFILEHLSRLKVSSI